MPEAVRDGRAGYSVAEGTQTPRWSRWMIQPPLACWSCSYLAVSNRTQSLLSGLCSTPDTFLPCPTSGGPLPRSVLLRTFQIFRYLDQFDSFRLYICKVFEHSFMW